MLPGPTLGFPISGVSAGGPPSDPHTPRTCTAHLQRAAFYILDKSLSASCCPYNLSMCHFFACLTSTLAFYHDKTVKYDDRQQQTTYNSAYPPASSVTIRDMAGKHELQALGREIRQRRIDKRIKSVAELARMSGISRQYLSALENGYVNPSRLRKPVTPTDYMLERLSKDLDIPMSRLHSLLGRGAESSDARSAEVDGVAQDFDRLPEWAKEIVRAAVRAAKSIVVQVEEISRDKNAPGP